MLGIIAAMSEELEPMLKEIVVERKEKKASMEFISGRIGENNVVLVVCGVGKVNAAVCTQILIDDFKTDKIINVGVAGALAENVLPGDVVIGEALIQHDMDTSYFGDKVGQIPRLDTYDFKCDKDMIEKAKAAFNNLDGHNCFTGIIVTGDQFISDEEKIKYLSTNFNAMACEMEGGSIAQVCYLNKVPFVVIRSISDNSLSGVHMEYEKFLPIGIKNSTTILKNMLKSM